MIEFEAVQIYRHLQIRRLLMMHVVIAELETQINGVLGNIVRLLLMYTTMPVFLFKEVIAVAPF